MRDNSTWMITLKVTVAAMAMSLTGFNRRLTIVGKRISAQWSKRQPSLIDRKLQRRQCGHHKSHYKSHLNNVDIFRDYLNNVVIFRDYISNVDIFKDHLNNVDIFRDHFNNVDIVRDHLNNVPPLHETLNYPDVCAALYSPGRTSAVITL